MIYDSTIDTISAIYDSYELNTLPNKVLGIDYRQTPDILLNKYQLAHADGEIVTNSNWGGKRIVIEGRTTGTSKDNLDSNLDTLYAKFSNYEKNLDIVVNGDTRRYIASLSDSDISIHECVATWKLYFACSATASATSSTTLTFGTYTTNSTSYANTVTGTYKSNAYIDFTVNYVDNWWDNKYIQIYSSTTSQLIRFTRAWNWFDRVVIDGANSSVNLYETAKTVIDDCDSETYWASDYTLSLDETNMLEGDGCIKVVMGTTASSMYFTRLNSTAIDLDSGAGSVIIPIFIPTPTSGSVREVVLVTGSDATLASNFCYFVVDKQYNGSALATNAWNYIEFDLSIAPTSTVGTPDRTAIKSIKLIINGWSASTRLDGVLLDYITLQKSSVTATPLDYEGTFIDLNIGSNTLVATDEFTTRNITITGSYIKRWL